MRADRGIFGRNHYMIENGIVKGLEQDNAFITVIFAPFYRKIDRIIGGGGEIDRNQ